MTSRPVRVLAIPGSLRRSSFNLALLENAATLTPPAMVLTVYRDLASIPVFNEDLEDSAPIGVTRLQEAVARADGIFIATPEYNQSVPGVVKNMVDWLSRSNHAEGLAGKPVAITGATTGPWGTRIAQTILRQMLHSTGSLVMAQPTLFIRDAETVFDIERGTVNAETTQRLSELLTSFDTWIRMVSTESPSQEPAITG